MTEAHEVADQPDPVFCLTLNPEISSPKFPKSNPCDFQPKIGMRTTRPWLIQAYMTRFLGVTNDWALEQKYFIGMMDDYSIPKGLKLIYSPRVDQGQKTVLVSLGWNIGDVKLFKVI